MAQHPQIDLHVAYCCLRGANSGYDPILQQLFNGMFLLLDGYNWVEIR